MLTNPLPKATSTSAPARMPKVVSTDVKQGIKLRLKSIFSAADIQYKESILKEYSISLNGSVVKPSYIVFPKHTKQVIDLVRIANIEKWQLFPISKGKNWGYGSAQASKANQIIVDLSRMNKILEVNEESAYIRIQSGVTQQQLYEYLQLANVNLQLDVTGAGPNTSIIGNVLERGFGHTDYGNRIEQVVNFTVVLPNGKVLKTGYGAYKNANAVNVYSHGVGPNLNGLFTQSNLGIITEMTLNLMPKPEKFCMFVALSNRTEDISDLVESIKYLRLNNVVNSAVHIANKSRAMENDKNKTVGAWALSGSISGPKALVNAKRKIVKQVFREKTKGVKLFFLTDFRIHLLKWINKNIFSISVYNDLKCVIDLQKGVPTNQPLVTLLHQKGLHSEVKTSNFPSHFRWICTSCRADKESVEEALGILQKAFKKWDYVLSLTCTFINPRTLILISSLTYPKTEQAIDKANRFYKICTDELMDKGYYPYRSGSGMYDALVSRRQSVTQHFLDDLKNTFDPNGILAVGKYGMG